jgi:hypothetical protein
VANEDHGHIALPKLYGAPAYARPPAVPVVRSERPIDPDDLPLEMAQTDEDRQLAAQFMGRADVGTQPSGPPATAGQDAAHLRARPFSLSALAGRLWGRDATSTIPAPGEPATGASVTFGQAGSVTGASPMTASGPTATSDAGIGSQPPAPASVPASAAGVAVGGSSPEGAQSAQAGTRAES